MEKSCNNSFYAKSNNYLNFQLNNTTDYINTNNSNLSKLDLIKNEFKLFLKNNTSYMCLSENSKIIVYNSELTITDTVNAMITEDIYCGLIWKKELGEFSGLFTLRDFLKILHMTYDKILKLDNKNINNFNDTKKLAANIYNRCSIKLEELDNIIENATDLNNSDIDMKIDINTNHVNSNSHISLDNEINNNVNLSQIQQSLNSNNNESKNIENLVYMDEDISLNNIINNNITNNVNFFYSNMTNYKSYFNIFNHVTLQDYISDLENNFELKKLVTLSLDISLLIVVEALINNKIHRVITEDKKTNSYAGIITYELIFDYFLNNYYSDMEVFNYSYKELIINNMLEISRNKSTDKNDNNTNNYSFELICSNLYYGCIDETIYSCFYKIYEYKISILPIINLQKSEITNNLNKIKIDFKANKIIKIIGFLHLKDLIYFYLNAENYKLNSNINTFLMDLYKEVNLQKPYGLDRVNFIDSSEELTIKQLFERIYAAPEKKIVFIRNNSMDELEGIVTLSELFKLLTSN